MDQMANRNHQVAQFVEIINKITNNFDCRDNDSI